MKKLVLSLLLSAVAANAFGMEAAKIAKYQYKLDMQKLANESKLALQKQAEDFRLAREQNELSTICLLGGAFLTIAGSYFTWQAWNCYSNMAARNAQNQQQATGSQKSNLAAYGKIAAGVGLTGLAAYLGMKQSQQPQSMVNEYSATGSYASVGNTLAPNIMISFGSAYTLAPIVPAYFFLKSGFKDLETK